MNTIIAIDPGKGGGIAVLNKGKAKVVNMPGDVSEMNDYFRYLRDTYPKAIVFIEKVQAYGAGDDVPGKKFAINKMLNNYTQLLTVIELIGFIYIEVYPISWQSGLGFGGRKPKEYTREQWKSIRKRKYKEFAQNTFPEVKVNLKVADALCILEFSKIKIQSDFDWVLERANKKTDFKFFK